MRPDDDLLALAYEKINLLMGALIGIAEGGERTASGLARATVEVVAKMPGPTPQAYLNFYGRRPTDSA